MAVININELEKLIVIGRYYNSDRKFRRVFPPENWMVAMGINLWNGRVWGIHKLTKKRILLKQVTN